MHGYLFLQDIYYNLGLDKICNVISKKYRIKYDLNGIEIDIDTWPGIPTYLEIEGKRLDSVQFSKQLENLITYGNSNLVFIIGGSNGLDKCVKERSNLALSFSDFTFPHQLMRLILVEQIYRSLTITHNKEYHK